MYSDEHLKLMRLAGLPVGYGIDEVTTSPPSPSIYELPEEEKADRSEFIPMGEYDFDGEVSMLVADAIDDLPQSEAATVVLSSLAKLQSLLNAATPKMSISEKSRVSDLLRSMNSRVCE